MTGAGVAVVVGGDGVLGELLPHAAAKATAPIATRLLAKRLLGKYIDVPRGISQHTDQSLHPAAGRRDRERDGFQAGSLSKDFVHWPSKGNT